MVSYTTAELDAIIAALETKLSSALEIRHGDKAITNRAAADIRSSIAYFEALYDTASDAPPVIRAKVRTYFGWGSKGIGFE